MCIRDRDLIGGEPDPYIIVVSVPGAREIERTAVVADQHEINPVSYTHLRAHETVLDLVCRLLLEKKKNTQTITITKKKKKTKQSKRCNMYGYNHTNDLHLTYQTLSHTSTSTL